MLEVRLPWCATFRHVHLVHQPIGDEISFDLPLDVAAQHEGVFAVLDAEGQRVIVVGRSLGLIIIAWREHFQRGASELEALPAMQRHDPHTVLARAIAQRIPHRIIRIGPGP